MLRKILITGGTGFVGSWFLNESLIRGIDLFALRRQMSLCRISLKKEPQWVIGDLDNFEKNVFEGVDTVVHLAAHSANYPYDSLENCVYWNVNATLRFLQSARDFGVQNFIVAGTAFEYGLSGDSYDRIPVNAPLLPTMSYPASKAMASIALNQWAIERKVKLRYIRLFQVYGEGELSTRLYPSLLKSALLGANLELSAGEQIRDFIHVKDVVLRLLDRLDFADVISGVPVFENLGNGIGSTVREFAEREWNRLGAKGKLSFGSLQYRENEIMRLVAG
jgi:dTDP-6-deoxy-L-talose 4-dehydrogenase (NAD+)